jgi:hypothetical protein
MPLSTIQAAEDAVILADATGDVGGGWRNGWRLGGCGVMGTRWGSKRCSREAVIDAWDMDGEFVSTASSREWVWVVQ